MPRTRTRKQHASQLTSGPTPKRTRTAAPDTSTNTSDIATMPRAELSRLPIEVLRLHLQDRHLVTTGNKATLSKRLYTSLHPQSPPQPPPQAPGTGHLPQPPATSLAALHNRSERLIDGSLLNYDGTVQQLLGALIQTARTMQQQPPTNPPVPQPPPADDNISLPSVLPTSDPQLGRDDLTPPQVSLPQPVPLPLPTDQHHQTPMPAITDKLKQKITRGEYLDFDLLLPDNMFPARETPSSSAFTLRLSSDTSTTSDPSNVIVAQPRPLRRRTVSDLSSWLEAWNVFIAINVAHYPARALPLLAYQRIIGNAASKHPPAEWLQYDSKFRALAACDKSLRWDVKHSDLWLECIRSPSRNGSSGLRRVRLPCTYCGSTSHYPDNCGSNPFRRPRQRTPPRPTTGTTARRTPLPPASFRDQYQSSPATSSRELCRDYNYRICTRSPCKHIHRCPCGGTHPYSECPRPPPQGP